MQDLAGAVFGHLTVLSRAANRGHRVTWLCRCACDARIEVRAHNLRNGHTVSCGCKGRGSVVDRFFAKVDRSSGDVACWKWTGAIAGEYGTFDVNTVQMPAHRAALILLRAATLPSGRAMHVDHLCGNKLCVNPDHLELVTARENIRRRDSAKEMSL